MLSSQTLYIVPATPAMLVVLVSPNRGTATDFNIRQYQAVGDGKTLDTGAIQQAIDACGKAGGGRVLFPPGNYLAGTLRLRSGIELHLEKDAKLIGVNNLESVTLERVKLTVQQPDLRPVVLVDDVDQLKTVDLQHSPVPEGVTAVIEVPK